MIARAPFVQGLVREPTTNKKGKKGTPWATKDMSIKQSPKGGLSVEALGLFWGVHGVSGSGAYIFGAKRKKKAMRRVGYTGG